MTGASRSHVSGGGERSHVIRASFAVVITVMALLTSGRALTELISFDLLTSNTAIRGYPAPFANVSIDRSDTTHANATFQPYSTGGFPYLMGDGSTVALNVNASAFTVGAVTEVNGLGGSFTSTWISTNIGNPGLQVDGWGQFNLTVDHFDGCGHTVTNVQFTLTNTSGPWATAVSHIFVCGE